PLPFGDEMVAHGRAAAERHALQRKAAVSGGVEHAHGHRTGKSVGQMLQRKCGSAGSVQSKAATAAVLKETEAPQRAEASMPMSGWWPTKSSDAPARNFSTSGSIGGGVPRDESRGDVSNTFTPNSPAKSVPVSRART